MVLVLPSSPASDAVSIALQATQSRPLTFVPAPVFEGLERLRAVESFGSWLVAGLRSANARTEKNVIKIKIKFFVNR